VTDRLAFVGFPRCRGGVMAINPVWRKTLSQWRAQVHRFIARRHAVMLQLFVLLYDFSIVQGEAAFGRELRACVTDEVRTHPQLAPDFYEVQAEHGTVLGVFRRLRTERRGEQRGKLNLKHGGTLPLVEAVRLMAMRHGVEATGTLARIAALEGSGLLSRDEVDHLRSAYGFITGLQLRTQIADVEAGREVSNHVHPDNLTERERNVLRDSLVAINGFRDRVRADMGGGLL
jgi:signal-transduction protein with cAMP-binding, CBS, and nucleotidyltransferase domain